MTSARSSAAPPPHLMPTSAAAAGVPARQPAAVQCHARQPHSQKQQARGRPLHDQRPGCSQGVGHCPVRGFRHRRGAGSLLSHRRHWPPYRECLTLICRHCIALLTACRLLHCNGHPAARTADCNRAERCALAVGWCLQDKPRGFPLPEMEQNDYEPLKKGGPLLPPPAAAACCLLPGAAPCSCRSHCSPHLTHLTLPVPRLRACSAHMGRPLHWPHLRPAGLRQALHKPQGLPQLRGRWEQLLWGCHGRVQFWLQLRLLQQARAPGASMGHSLRHSQAQFVPTTPYPLPPQGLCCPVAGWCPQGLSFLSFFPVLPTGSVLLKSMKPATADTFKNAYSAGWLRD